MSAVTVLRPPAEEDAEQAACARCGGTVTFVRDAWRHLADSGTACDTPTAQLQQALDPEGYALVAAAADTILDKLVRLHRAGPNNLEAMHGLFLEMTSDGYPEDLVALVVSAVHRLAVPVNRRNRR